MGDGRAFVCEICGKAGPIPKHKTFPEGWRRVTVTNPDVLRRYGISGYVCGKPCGKKLIDKVWGGDSDH